MPFDLHAFDWAATSLGPKSTWPQPLRTIYDLMMSTGFGMCATWGPEQTMVYNDAYAEFLGARHPAALGQPLHIVWHEVWDDIQPLVERALSGEAVKFENMHLVMTRKGYEEDTYWTFCYSPISDGDMVKGFLNVASETTAVVVAQQRAQNYSERVQLAMAAGAIIGTWVWHIPTNAFTVDDGFADSFGLNPNVDVSTLTFDEVIVNVHPHDIPGLREAMADAMLRGGAYAHQYRVKRDDGRYYWLEANGKVEFGADGKALRFPGVLIDVERRREVEAERDQALARLRALNTELEQKVIAQSLARGRTWQLSPDILGVLGEDGRFETSNPAWQRVLGWSEDDVANRTFFDLVHPDDAYRTREAWNQSIGQGLPVLRIENRWRHRDGRWCWLSWVAVTEDNKTYCSARDITAEKDRQTALIARTAERDRLWETTNDLMGTAGLDGFLKAINPAWTTHLGWSREELLNQPVMALIDPALHAQASDVLDRLAAGEEFTGYVNRMVCRDGSFRSIMWTAKPDPGTAQFFMVGRDVTAQHAAEESLRQSQKMEAVGQLTGGIAHDFNNLLAGISGSLELMTLRIDQGRFDDLERYMAAAKGASQRAATLTHRLLAFSRRQTLAPSSSDINRVIADMVDLVQRTVGPAIVIEHQAEPALWTALVDVSQFENALLNLCINARDAMPGGGCITIQTHNRIVDAALARQLDLSAGQYLAICVRDTGEGMSATVLAKAFEPFFTTKPIGQGTGLGLSMIYGFARQSGGQVKMQSTLGSGTEVCIFLPRHRGEIEGENALAPAPDLMPAESEETVLVVDDEPTVRMLVVEVLHELGYKALEAGDAVAALKLLESDARVDLLVSDVGLPGGMNGRQVADRARTIRPDLKVLFITGYAENVLLRDGHLEHNMSVLTKPFSVQTLVTTIRDLLAG